MNPPLTAAPKRSVAECKKCNAPMKRVSGWNWCSRCGYREEGVEEFAPALTGDQTPAAKSGAGTSELALAFRAMPSWGWFLVLGLCVVGAVSGIANHNLPDKSYARAVWSTIQVLGGLALFLITGLAVSNRLRAMHQQLSLVDFLLPDRLWVLAVKNLPATRWHICTAAWTLTAVLCGIIWIGGLTYWLPTKSKAKAGHVFAKKTVKAATKDEDLEDESSKAEKPPVAKSEEPTPEEPAENGSAKKTEPTEKTVTKCVIVGYTTKDGQLAGLLVGTVRDKELHYAGIVPAPEDAELRKDLLKRSDALKTDTPTFPDLEVKATWLKPRLSCEVESKGVDENQLLKESAFKGLIFPKIPRPAPLPAEDGKDEKGKSAGKAGDGKNLPEKKKPAVGSQTSRRWDLEQLLWKQQASSNPHFESFSTNSNHVVIVGSAKWALILS